MNSHQNREWLNHRHHHPNTNAPFSSCITQVLSSYYNQEVNMSTTGQKLKVAAIQAEPAWNDLEGGVNKSIALIEQAAAQGAQVVGFPEVFIPGYPW